MIVVAPPRPARAPVRAALPTFAVCKLTLDQYHRMIETGILQEDDSLEFIHGWLVPKMPQNKPHKLAIPLTLLALLRALPPGWFPNMGQPVQGLDSEPEPDASVVRGDIRDYPDGTPGPDGVGTLAEISDTSLEYDRDVKGPLYAASGYAIYWIINLVDAQVEVYTIPVQEDGTWRYRDQQTYTLGEAVPLVLDGKEVARIPVRDLIP
jgi:Uma2 family endonuclease